MALALSPKIRKLISDRIESGDYRSADELLTAALASLDQRQQIAKLDKKELRLLYPGMAKKIAQGLADIESGRVSDGEEFFEELEQEEKTRRPHPKTA